MIVAKVSSCGITTSFYFQLNNLSPQPLWWQEICPSWGFQRCAELPGYLACSLSGLFSSCVSTTLWTSSSLPSLAVPELSDGLHPHTRTQSLLVFPRLTPTHKWMTTLNKNPLSKLINKVPSTVPLRVRGQECCMLMMWSHRAHEDVHLSFRTTWKYRDFLELKYDSPLPQINWNIGKHTKGISKELEQKDKLWMQEKKIRNKS